MKLTSKRKYRNHVLTIGGAKFDSKKEYARYQQLLQLQRAGVISGLKHQVRFELVKGVRFKAEARAKSAIYYVADFAYFKDGQYIVEDVKSAITRKDAVYRIKKHLMMAILNIEISEV